MKVKMQVLLAATVMVLGSQALAHSKVECTTEPKDKWQDQTAFQDKLKADGYKIKVFKVTKGNCYEIYGWDKEGKKVEIYFNPITAAVVKEERK